MLRLPFGYEEICRVLPHRHPFLLVDQILEWEPRSRIIGIKNASSNEPYFTGHFPDHPVMPGVLIVEAMAQVAGLLAMESFDTPTGFFYLAAIEKARFRRSVRPGDQLVTEATLKTMRRAVLKTHAIARVGDEFVAQGDFTFVISGTSASALILSDTIHGRATRN